MIYTYKIKRFILGIKKLISWIPIIWKDRDWDHFYIYEILKQKLIQQSKHLGQYNERDVERINLCISLINKVQNEYYIDQYLESAEAEKEWTTDGITKAVAKHDKAKRVLFSVLHNYIETWWI